MKNNTELLQFLTVLLVSSYIFRTGGTIIWVWSYLLTLSKPLRIKIYEEVLHWFL